jgi:hypothetical protein
MAERLIELAISKALFFKNSLFQIKRIAALHDIV